MDTLLGHLEEEVEEDGLFRLVEFLFVLVFDLCNLHLKDPSCVVGEHKHCLGC